MSSTVSNVSSTAVSISAPLIKQKVPSVRAQKMAFLTLFGSAHDAIAKGAKADFPCPLRLRTVISYCTHTIYGVGVNNTLAVCFDERETRKLSFEELRKARNQAIDDLASTAHSMLLRSEASFKKELDEKVLQATQEGYKRVWAPYDSFCEEGISIRRSLKDHLPQTPPELIRIIASFVNPIEDLDSYLATISVVPIVNFLSSRLHCCSSEQAKAAVLKYPSCPQDSEAQSAIVGRVDECYQGRYYQNLFEAIGQSKVGTLEGIKEIMGTCTDKPNTDSLQMDAGSTSIFEDSWSLTSGHEVTILNGNGQLVFTTAPLPKANFAAE